MYIFDVKSSIMNKKWFCVIRLVFKRNAAICAQFLIMFTHAIRPTVECIMNLRNKTVGQIASRSRTLKIRN